MSQAILPNYLIVGAILFGLGAIGFLSRRNLILMFLSAEMMLQGVALNLVGFGGHHKNYQGQAFVIFMLTVAACEAALALALILVLFRNRKTLDVSVWQDLREANQDPVQDESPLLLEPEMTPMHFPRLTPAGLRPDQAASPEEAATRG